MIILKAALFIVVIALLACAGIAGYACILLKRRPPLLLYESRKKQPGYLRLDQIPGRQLELLIRQEDPHFYAHHGFDFESIRDAWQTNHREKRIVQGASTIPQQLAKNLYLHFDQNYLRKMVEALIALRLERLLGKDRMLEMYANIIYFGNGTYGMDEAARFYFGKPANDLTLNQMVILVIIPAAPTGGNPIQHPEAFERMRNKYLYRFTDDKPLISQAEAEIILSHAAACLDPELRKPDDFTRNYPQTIPMINERYGPF